MTATSLRKEILTRREVQVIELVSLGLANKAVAGRLGLQEGTVKVHLHNIFQKLNVSSRTGLILKLSDERMENHAALL